MESTSWLELGKRELQKWRCKACTHTFYTPVGKKQVWYRRIFHRTVKIECPVCGKVTAKKVKVVVKEKRK